MLYTSPSSNLKVGEGHELVRLTRISYQRVPYERGREVSTQLSNAASLPWDRSLLCEWMGRPFRPQESFFWANVTRREGAGLDQLPVLWAFGKEQEM
jgi:hypothetical protein